MPTRPPFALSLTLGFGARVRGTSLVSIRGAEDSYCHPGVNREREGGLLCANTDPEIKALVRPRLAKAAACPVNKQRGA